MEQHPHDFIPDNDRDQDTLVSEMISTGQARARSQIIRAVEHGRAADTPAGRAVAWHVTNDLTEALLRVVGDAASGQAGRRYASAAMLADAAIQLGYEDHREFLRKVAVIALRNAVNAATNREKGGLLASTVGTNIGNDIADEVLAERMNETAPGLLTTVLRNSEARHASPRHQAAAVRTADARAELGLRPDWSDTDKRDIGLVVLDCLASLGNVITLTLRPGRRGQGGWFVEWADGAEEWFTNWNGHAIELGVWYLPTTTPPVPWSSLRGGGYGDTAEMRPLPLVKRLHDARFRAQREALEAADLTHVYAAVNAIQATPWKINVAVLDVLEALWENGGSIAGLPAAEPEPQPIMTNAVASDKEGGSLRAAYRGEAAAVHARNAATLTDRLEAGTRLRVARKFASADAIYFPHNLDYRGRVYSVPQVINPQGGDLQRGLLTFATGKPLGAEGARWLAIHGANVLGKTEDGRKLDKLPFTDRIAWAHSDDTRHRACAVARDPFGNLSDWIDADEPVQFLAWCIEWSAYLESGERDDIVSCLPVAMDGTCNGLQHLAAMTRDETTGAAVNLVPIHTPQDIYQRVADAVVARLRTCASNDDERAWLASAWLAFGIDRPLVKPAVMTLPYGATRHGRFDKLREAVNERIAKDGSDRNFGGDTGRAVNYLVDHLEAVLRESVAAPMKAMQWLQSTAAKFARERNAPVRWTTPSGFVVVNDLRVMADGGLVSTYFHGRRVRLRLQRPTQDQDVRRHRSKSAPDFVHSLDASHLVATVNAASSKGVSAFWVIHDHFGTHAADAESLAKATRSTFVEMYTQHDVLGHKLINGIPRFGEQ